MSIYASGRPVLPLQSFQIGYDVVLFLIGKHVLVSGHAIAAGIDLGLHVLLGDLLAVLQLVALEEAFQARAHLLFVGIGIVTDGALLEEFLTLSGVPRLVVAKHVLARHQRAQTAA